MINISGWISFTSCVNRVIMLLPSWHSCNVFLFFLMVTCTLADGYEYAFLSSNCYGFSGTDLSLLCLNSAYLHHSWWISLCLFFIELLWIYIKVINPLHTHIHACTNISASLCACMCVHLTHYLSHFCLNSMHTFNPAQEYQCACPLRSSNGFI